MSLLAPKGKEQPLEPEALTRRSTEPECPMLGSREQLSGLVISPPGARLAPQLLFHTQTQSCSSNGQAFIQLSWHSPLFNVQSGPPVSSALLCCLPRVELISSTHISFDVISSKHILISTLFLYAIPVLFKQKKIF